MIATSQRVVANVPLSVASGIIRVHQFDKVEMFVYCKPEDSYEQHKHLLAMEEEMLGKVEVPYRVIDTATEHRTSHKIQ